MSARVLAMDTSVGQGARTFVHPFASFFRKGRSQVIYLVNELGPARQLAALGLEVVNPPGQILNNWTIRLKHTGLSAYANPAAWDACGWTTVYQTNQAVSSNGWIFFPFTTPFAYNGVNNLLVDFSFNNGSYSFDGQCRSTDTGQSRTLALATDNTAYGDPLGWSGSAPSGVLYSDVPNIRLTTLS